MALHPNLQSMLHESLPEKLFVAKYCIEYKKEDDPKKEWPTPGCYGYPAALLLLSIADTIGSFVEEGNVEDHFKILNNSKYYGLNFTREELKIVYNKYRNLLSHHSLLSTDTGLRIGKKSIPVLIQTQSKYWLNLVPFYLVSVQALSRFLEDSPDVLKDNQALKNIYRK